MKRKDNSGITLIALVITIIVLLILSGVSIAMLRGQNGIITQAKNAKAQSESSSAEEKVNAAIIATISKSKKGTIDADKLVAEITNNYGGTASKTNDGFPVNATVDGKDFSIDKDGNITEGKTSAPEPTEKISKSKSYLGYYADIDGDGTVDGIIYADLAFGNQGDGQWKDKDGDYTIPKVEDVSKLKDYYISQKDYKANEGFGTKDVITPTGTGSERFYIMALTDFNNGTTYDWYNTATGKMTDYSSTTSVGFGKGKSNTSAMISKWNSKKYGEQDKCSSHKDIWGQIQAKVDKGWFIPSRAEWAAFGEELKISQEKYADYELSPYYWTSSQRNSNLVWGASIDDQYVYDGKVNNNYYVRLSAMF